MSTCMTKFISRMSDAKCASVFPFRWEWKKTNGNCVIKTNCFVNYEKNCSFRIRKKLRAWIRLFHSFSWIGIGSERAFQECHLASGHFVLLSDRNQLFASIEDNRIQESGQMSDRFEQPRTAKLNKGKNQLEIHDSWMFRRSGSWFKAINIGSWT